MVSLPASRLLKILPAKFVIINICINFAMLNEVNPLGTGFYSADDTAKKKLFL